MEGTGQAIDDDDIGAIGGGGRAISPGLGEATLGGTMTKSSMGMKVKSFPNPNVIM